MQNKYSLAYAMAKDGQGIFSNADNAKGARLSAQALWSLVLSQKRRRFPR